MEYSFKKCRHSRDGILFVALFALSSVYLAEIPWIAHTGISPVVIAIVFGIIFGNTLHHKLPHEWAPGIQFCAKKILRLAIILYGFRVSFQQITEIGTAGLLIDIVIVAVTLCVGYLIGTKVFKLDRDLSILISSGTAICGAAAVLAVEDVLKSAPYKTSMAVGTVVLFGTLGMFLYPLLQHAHLLAMTDNQYGFFTGATVHEVAQVIVAGTNVSASAGATAVIVKMTRVLLLVPVLLMLSVWVNYNRRAKSNQKTKIMIPWFALGFAAMIAFNSLNILPLYWLKLINQFDTFLLTMAMAAIGIETNLSKLKKVGMKPLYFAITLFSGLVPFAYFLIMFCSHIV